MATSMVVVDSSGNLSSLAFPPGIIVLWSGSSDRIPEGWTLCNGVEGGSPDLSGRFVVGVGTLDRTRYSTGEKGGLERVTLTVDEIPSHTHVTTLPKDNVRWGTMVKQDFGARAKPILPHKPPEEGCPMKIGHPTTLSAT